MSIRRFLAAYVLLNAGLYGYSLVRYGLPPDAFSWGCVAFGVFVLVLLVRGSRGAWVLSFFGSTLALVFGVAVLLREDGPTLEWAFIAFVYAMQVAILLTPDVREYIRRASYERAIRAHRSW
jgi:uncharacterized membrane protein YccC